MLVETDTIFGSCPQNYTIHRTFTATDNCDNSATANQLIVVADLTAPELTIPENYAIECDEALILEVATAIDNCDSNPLIEVIDEVVNVQATGTYSLNRTFTVTDACGNSSTAQQTIDVSDTSPPYFTSFPDDLVLTCGEEYPEEAVLFEDLCDPSPVLVEVSTVEDFQDCANATTIFRTYVIEDDAGNSYYQTQIITFVDDEPPFFTNIPEDYTTDCANNITLEFPWYDDLCSAGGMSLDIETTVENELCEDHFDLVRVFTITDACGLSSETSQTISVRDVTPPLLITELDSLFYHCASDVPLCEEMILDLDFQDECGSTEFFTSCEDVVVEGDCELQACVWERSYYWEDGCGNQDSTSHFIRVNESVFVPTLPTGMTPNSDGYNDAYVILDIGPLIAPGELAPCNWVDNTLFRVVNRWGAIVFEEENYRNDWEGTNQNGEPLPAGTYFVVFEASGQAYSTFVDIRR
jgi:gliding motility-associated-like protein